MGKRVLERVQRKFAGIHLMPYAKDPHQPHIGGGLYPAVDWDSEMILHKQVFYSKSNNQFGSKFKSYHFFNLRLNDTH